MDMNYFSKSRIALGLLMPLALFAQTPEFPVTEATAPPEVSQALRERVNQFFGYHVGTMNRRAIDLVAEDTKDYYFSSGKVQFLSAKVTGMEFSRDLQRAVVHVETTQTLQVQQYSTVATTPVMSNWKLEDGKWVFFLDTQALNRHATPMGESAQPAGKLAAQPLVNADGTLNIPADFAEPTRVAAQGQAILSQAGLDKEAVTLEMQAAGEDLVTFHNGFNGSVTLQLSGDPRVAGLKIALDKVNLNGSEDAHLRVSWDPAVGTPSALGAQYTVRLNLIPFNQEYPVKITLRGTAAR